MGWKRIKWIKKKGTTDDRPTTTNYVPVPRKMLSTVSMRFKRSGCQFFLKLKFFLTPLTIEDFSCRKNSSTVKGAHIEYNAFVKRFFVQTGSMSHVAIEGNTKNFCAKMGTFLRFIFIFKFLLITMFSSLDFKVLLNISAFFSGIFFSQNPKHKR